MVDLEQEVQELRRLSPRLAELADLVQELLVPAAKRDDERLKELLDDYDSYYSPGWEDKLENDSARRLPVLKVVFDDAERTLVYVDPHTGEAVGAYDASGRRLRWLYHGLHSLDFAGFYAARPLWDLIVLPLMIGGVAMSVTCTWIGYKWLRRKLRKPGPQKRRVVSAAS